MPDLAPNPRSDNDSGDNTRVRAGRGSITSIPPATPVWVKVSGIIVAVLVAVFVILHLTGNSPGGMAGHAPLLQHWVQLP